MEVVTDLVIKIFVPLIIVVYVCCLVIIFCYSLLQLNMLKYFKIYQKKNKLKCKIPEKLPRVTIQLPLYNEFYVIKRLLKCITNLEYPKELIQIQVLDDSTDESLLVTKKIVSKCPPMNPQITTICPGPRCCNLGRNLGGGLLCAPMEKGTFLPCFAPRLPCFAPRLPRFLLGKKSVPTLAGHHGPPRPSFTVL